MEWDLGARGLLALGLMSLVFGVISVAVLWHRVVPWIAAVAGTALFFVAGLFVSEGLVGWATVAELQPNVDGLSLDEVLFIYPLGIAVLLVIRYMVGRTAQHRLAH
jgi:hypothetical protein